MNEKIDYYLVPVDKEWRLKRKGGVRALRIFPSREEALAYAEILIGKQGATLRVQNPDGTWDTR